MEDPKLAKGLVKREVIRVVTPGTITSAQALDETKNNYLMGIIYIGDMFGISTADISTGDFLVTEVSSERALIDEINKFAPSEIICNEAFYMSGVDLEELKNRCHVAISALDSHFYSDESCRRVLLEHFKVNHLDGLGLGDYETGVIAAGAVMQYLYETQKNSLGHITTIHPLFHGAVYDYRHIHQKESGAGGDDERKTEAGNSFVGPGQNQDRHGRPAFKKLY